MGAMTVRNLSPNVTAALKRRAREESRSLNALINEILQRAVEEDLRRRRILLSLPKLKRLQRKLARKFRGTLSSEEIIRRSRGK